MKHAMHSNNTYASYAVPLLLSIVLRLLLCWWHGWSVPTISRSFAATSFTLQTPLTAYSNVNEALALQASGQHHAYSTNVYHSSVYYLQLHTLLSMLSISPVLLSIAADCVNSCILRQLAISYYQTQQPHVLEWLEHIAKHGDGDGADATKACVSATLKPTNRNAVTTIATTPLLCQLLYLFNPFTVIACVTCTSTPYLHMLLLLSVLGATQQHRYQAALYLALAAAVFEPWTLLMIPTVSTLLHQSMCVQQSNKIQSPSAILQVLLPIALTTLSFYAMLVAAAVVADPHTWQGHYVYYFRSNDNSPNIGLWWYFQSEIFSRFTGFFNAIFHTHMAIYVLPAAIRFVQEPMMVTSICLSIATIFQPYPTLDRVMLSLCLLLVNSPLILPYLRRLHLVVWLLLIAIVQIHLMWFLWLYAGSGNANFIYFQTLLLAGTQGFLLIECSTSARRFLAARNLHYKASQAGQQDKLIAADG